MEKVDKLEFKDVPVRTLEALERVGLYSSHTDLVRMAQGWISYDNPVKKEQFKMIEDIISSRKVTVHFENARGKPFELTSKQKEQMKIVLKAFKANGGKF